MKTATKPVKGKHGGARPGSGRPKGVPNTTPRLRLEVHGLLKELDVELATARRERREGNATAALVLRKLVALERAHGAIERIEVPRHTRRRPLGH